MRSSPWFQHRRSESAPPAQRQKEPPSISAKEQDENTERLLRPTESVMNRQNLYWKLDSYMDRGFHSWSKMDLFDDCKRCMYTPQGRLKDSCKIRPVNVTLPPLNGHKTSSLIARSSLQKPSMPSTAARGRVTWRLGDMHSSGAQGVRGQGVRSSLPTPRSLPMAPIARSSTQYSIGV